MMCGNGNDHVHDSVNLRHSAGTLCYICLIPFQPLTHIEWQAQKVCVARTTTKIVRWCADWWWAKLQRSSLAEFAPCARNVDEKWRDGSVHVECTQSHTQTQTSSARFHVWHVWQSQRKWAKISARPKTQMKERERERERGRQTKRKRERAVIIATQILVCIAISCCSWACCRACR